MPYNELQDSQSLHSDDHASLEEVGQPDDGTLQEVDQPEDETFQEVDQPKDRSSQEIVTKPNEPILDVLPPGVEGTSNSFLAFGSS
jgi:hypothetical protein